ncbi:MAG: hypothetical protein PHC69_12370 [Ruminiclostridium sp.]|nr:hypothetical protein [Ruminiclostridium sp.]
MKKAIAFFTILIMISIPQISAAEQVPYIGYTYDKWNVAIPSTVGYLPDAVYYGDLNLEVRFRSPEDMYVSEDGRIFVLDTGNNRVVVLNSDFTLNKVIETFKMSDGTDYTLFSPKGIFVRGDLMYIADYDNMNVIVSDFEGNISLKLSKPDNPTFPQTSEFRPLKVLADSQGRIYTLVLGVYQGAAVFTSEGEFVDFFGSNTVKPTVKVLMDQFWKRIMNREQKDQLANYVPVQFTNFDITPKDFVYSCTAADISGISEICRINPTGKNLWTGDSMGDLEVGWYKNKGYYTAFTDVAVTADDFLFSLDSTKGRIFLYDPEGNLVFIFGGKGNQKGTFSMPSAIEIIGDKVLVLDTSKNSITTFSPTEYGEMVNEALRLYIEGNYPESQEIWETVLKQDGNMYTAYIGIGKALYYSGKYKEAIYYFREGSDRINESRAFEEYRSSIIRAYFPYVMSVVSVLFLAGTAWFTVGKIRKRRKDNKIHA